MRLRNRFALASSAALLMAASLGTADTLAQPTQPIYVQYDGFVRNKDGSLTISFGYYNMNNVDVTIPVGDANSFAPAPGDRNQPVVFLKGRHRFVCSMVVDKSFDGRLQWTIGFAGKTNVSTLKALDPLYELELNSEKRSLQGLDIAAASKNVCINRPPVVQVAMSPFEAPSTGSIELPGKVGQEVAINAQVEDDGLPRGSKVTSSWRKTSGPGDVTFSDAATGPTRVKFAAAGNYELELSATDGEKTGKLKVTVHVADK
ncbi:MAG TPA: hypothetical protein VH497_10865 [Vicinamibacterales bacterium]|jgi:hypothetical protein